MRTAVSISLSFLALVLGQGFAQPGPSQADLDAAFDNSRDWLYATHDYSGQRYVQLDQIDVANAGRLAPVCMFQLGEIDTFQSNGLVYDGVLFTSTPSSTYAIDAANCRELWRHTWQPTGSQGIASQRGLAILEGRIFRGTRDGHVIALDATSGELLWATLARAEGSNEGISMAPLVFGGLVIVGPAGTDRGWLQAFDVASGEPVWRFDTIPLPDSEGYDSWSDPEALEAGEAGGASVWTVMSLDHEAGILYVPVGNPNPAFYGGNRLGDNLYTNSVLALDVRSGELLWYDQLRPHELRNWDTSQAGPLFTAVVDGAERRLLAAAGKDGLLRILDRDSQERLFEVPVTTQSNVDVPSTPDGVHVCPGYLGGVQWNGAAYHPGTGLLYTPAVDWCSVFILEPEGTRGGTYRMDPAESASGWVTAVDPTRGLVRWRYRTGAPAIAGVTATSGDVVFAGDIAGRFVALNARNGDELYRFETGGAMAGGILTYQVDGRQLVAVMSGNPSGLWGSKGSPTVIIFGLPD